MRELSAFYRQGAGFMICLLVVLTVGCAGTPVSGSTRAEWQKRTDWHYTNADWEAAEEGCLALTRIEPVTAQDWFRLGNVYTHTDRPRAAVEAYAKALALAPERGDIHYNHALTLMRLAINEWEWAMSLGDAPRIRQKVSELLESLLEQFAEPTTDS